MIDWSWITTTGTAVLMVVLSALGIYLTLVLFTRLAGLRSFSKMSSFDFAITVGIGTVPARSSPKIRRSCRTWPVLPRSTLCR